jgi:hypothetical protein
MVQRHVVQLIDDLDGSPIDGNGSTVKFGLNGKSYEIDLTEANATKLRDALAPFIKGGRSTGTTRAPRARDGRNSSGDLAAIRSWANANGYTVGDRGRIPAAVRDAYDSAH